MLPTARLASASPSRRDPASGVQVATDQPKGTHRCSLAAVTLVECVHHVLLDAAAWRDPKPLGLGPLADRLVLVAIRAGRAAALAHTAANRTRAAGAGDPAATLDNVANSVRSFLAFLVDRSISYC